MYLGTFKGQNNIAVSQALQKTIVQLREYSTYSDFFGGLVGICKSGDWQMSPWSVAKTKTNPPVHNTLRLTVIKTT